MSMETNYLVGQLLVAMPGIEDPTFEKSVIYMCAHTEEGAMGLCINRLEDAITFDDLLVQLEIDPGDAPPIEIHMGGPVQSGRGFVLHTTEYVQPTSLLVDDDVALTATVDVVEAIATGRGPQRCLMALGYSGWGPGQLEDEMVGNGWLTVPADPDIVFDLEHETKWSRALKKIGIDPMTLSARAGHA